MEIGKMKWEMEKENLLGNLEIFMKVYLFKFCKFCNNFKHNKFYIFYYKLGDW